MDNKMKLSKEEIKTLIKKGYDLELISFEFEIPIERIKQCKSEIEKNTPSSKMEQLRERYNTLFFDKDEINQPQKPKKEETELINLTIAQIEKKLKDIEGLSVKERNEGARKIISKIKKIQYYQLTIDQAEKIYYVLDSKTLQKLKISIKDKIDADIYTMKKTIIGKLAEAVDIAQSQTEEIEELKKLEKKLTPQIQQKKQISVGAVKRKIEDKILKINQKNARERIRNNVSKNIEQIVMALADGTLDVKNANKIIEEEAKNRVESKTKNRFTLTEEQEKRQIQIQIKTLLMERTEQYHIENPQKTIDLIQELCCGEQEQALRTVVKHFTYEKDFDKAKEICNEFSRKNNGIETLKYMKILKREIKNDEISDMIVKGINMNGTPEEERAYFKLIEKGIEMDNVKLNEISLGKSQDGLRNITLENIWTDKEERKTR